MTVEELQQCPETMEYQVKQKNLMRKIRFKQERLQELQESFWDEQDEFELENAENVTCLTENDELEIAKEKQRIFDRKETREAMVEKLKFELEHDMELLDGIVNMKEITFFRENKIRQCAE